MDKDFEKFAIGQTNVRHTQGNPALLSMQTSMMRSTTVQSHTSSRTSSFTAFRACPKARKQVVVSAQVRRGASCGKSAGLLSALPTVFGSDLKSTLLRTGRGQNKGPSKGSQRVVGCSSCSAARFDRHVSDHHICKSTSCLVADKTCHRTVKAPYSIAYKSS